MAFSGSTSLDFTMASSGSAGYSHQAVPHDPQVSSSVFVVPTSFCFSTTDVLLLRCLGSLSVWGHLRSGLKSAMPDLCIMAPGSGHLGHGMLPQTYKLPDWWSSPASSLYGPHGTSLVVGSGMILSWLPGSL